MKLHMANKTISRALQIGTVSVKITTEFNNNGVDCHTSSPAKYTMRLYIPNCMN